MTFRRVLLPVAIAALLLPLPAMAQLEPSPSAPLATGEALTGFFVTTPTPEFTSPLEDTVSIPLTLSNLGLPPQRASFEVIGLPEDWSWQVLSGNTSVSAAIVAPNETQPLFLEITPAGTAEVTSYSFDLIARHDGQTTTLPLTVTFSQTQAGGVTLEPELPALRGTASSTFTYRMELSNESAEDALFNLAAQAPRGFTTTFKRGFGSEQITGIPVEAGASETVTLELRPNANIAAGQYPVVVEVLAGELTATAELSAEITGSPDLGLSGPNERLSGTATAGQTTTFPFVVANSGSAEATGVRLSANAPSGWTVEVAPEEIPTLAAGTTQQVDVAITPSEQAIAGDYMVTVRASGEEGSESAQFRVTVQTSTFWGIVGLGVIAVAAIILVLAVLRYGRR